MTRREPFMVLVLSFVTCFFYAIYWHYVCTEELKQVSGRQDISGLTDTLLGIVTCGIWIWFAQYRNAQIVHQTLVARGVQHADRSQTVLLLHVLTMVVGMTGLVAMFVLQEEYNQLAT